MNDEVINMNIKKYICKISAATMIVGSLTFAPHMYNLPVMSVAHAEIKTCTGTGEYIMSKKETPEFAEINAKIAAERAAIEQAGIYIHSHSKAVNERLTVDEVVTFAGGIVKVEVTDVDAISLTGEGKGYIKYRVTVKAQVDTNSINEALNKWLGRGSQTNSTLTEQNKSLQQQVKDLQKRNAELEKQILNAKTEQQKQEVTKIFEALDKDALALQKFNAAYNSKDYNEKIKLYSEAIYLKPNYEYAYNNRGHAYIELEKYDLAIQDLNKAISLNPKNDMAYNNRGVAYMDGLKQYNQAIADFNKAISLNQKLDKAYYNRGNSYRYLGQYERSIQDYNKAIELNPKYTSAYNNRGVAYEMLKEYSRALADYTKAIELNPNKALYYSNRGDVYKALGDNKKAQTDYEKAKQLKNKQ